MTVFDKSYVLKKYYKIPPYIDNWTLPTPQFSKWKYKLSVFWRFFFAVQYISKDF